MESQMYVQMDGWWMSEEVLLKVDGGRMGERWDGRMMKEGP
jgi:hypothetical protein